MSSSKEFRDFVLEELRNLGDISYKPMMGEFLLYYDGIYFVEFMMIDLWLK